MINFKCAVMVPTVKTCKLKMFEYIFSNHLLPINCLIGSETIPSKVFQITRISTSRKEVLLVVISSTIKENLF